MPPGDSDYDDIQQIKHNSNRAAGLTRQLLAFSRQQTLRPQVLQLPDVIAEIGNLLKRLLGETVTLEVKHGRSLGAVRADPGQLEQVIVNLAVNARDAMLEKGGGMLTIRTYPVSAAQVRDIGTDILPVADYSALSVTDTGAGIPADILPKIFEPFFTTKEVGKGTGSASPPSTASSSNRAASSSPILRRGRGPASSSTCPSTGRAAPRSGSRGEARQAGGAVGYRHDPARRGRGHGARRGRAGAGTAGLSHRRRRERRGRAGMPGPADRRR